MGPYKLQIFQSIAVLILYMILFFVTNKVINNALKKANLQRTRRKITIKALHLFTTIAALVVIAGIWGLEQNEIALFASTILTAIGIAFFAQWSLLSNITSSIILFFTHPLKLGDTIRVHDKDFPFEGEVTELTYFFVHLKTKNGEIVTIPNSMMLQKSIAIIPAPKIE